MKSKEFGILLIITSVVLNTATLNALRRISESPVAILNILIFAYFVAAALMLLQQAYKKLPLGISNLRVLFSIIWGAVIFDAYLIFLFHVKELTVAQLLLAQSTSPYFSVFVSGDWRKISLGNLLHDSIPLLFLLALAATASNTEKTGGLFYFFVIVMLFTLSQAVSRYAAKEPSQLAVAQSLGFTWVAIWILIWITMNKANLMISTEGLLTSIGIGSAVYCIQFLFLLGLQRSSPILGALASSVSVPIAVSIQSFSQKKTSWISLLLCALYCLAIAIRSKKKSAKILAN